MTNCSIHFKLVWALSCSGKILKSSLLTPITDICQEFTDYTEDANRMGSECYGIVSGFEPIIETVKENYGGLSAGDILSFNPYHNPFWLGYVLTRHWRHREIKVLAQGHTASEWWSHVGLFLLRKVFCSQCLDKCIWVFLVENQSFSAVMDWHLSSKQIVSGCLMSILPDRSLIGVLIDHFGNSFSFLSFICLEWLHY